MNRFGSLCILFLTALLMLLTVMACSEEDSAPLTPATAPSSATASPEATTPKPTATPSLITIDCNDPRFTKQILELSEDNQNQFSPRILKLYSDAEEIERTESVLRCRGTATLSRGGESNITYHYEIDRDGDAFIGYEIGDPIATPTPATSPSPGFTLDNPLSAGEPLQGSDGTETRVLGVVEDARRQVAEENQFNDPPQEGKRFYMVSVEVSYPSGSSSIAVSDTDFSLIGENRVVYDSFDYDCGVIPNELDGEVYGGGRIQGNICFEIPDDEGGFILIHEPGYGADSRRFLRLTYGEAKEPTPTPEATASPTTTPMPMAIPTPESKPTEPATSEPTSEPAPTEAAASEPTSEPAPTRDAPVGFGPGTYQVGEDVSPGTYAGRAGTGILDSCTWERLSGASGEFSDIIAIEIANGQFYVEVLDTDRYFRTSCVVTVLDEWPVPDEPLSMIGIGTHMIGRDISPGTYAGRAGTGILDSCTWERLSGVSGEFSELVAIEIANGQFYVEVLDTDRYFRTSCVVTSLDEWPMPDEPSSTIDIGTHIIGRDILPGTYTGRAGTGVLDSCTWERLSGVSGEFSELIAIEIANGQFYVEVLDTDRYLRTPCVLELVE